MKKTLSLRTRVLATVIVMVALGFAVTITVLTMKSARLQQETAMDYAEQLAWSHAGRIKSRLDVALDAARTVGQSLDGMRTAGKPDREVADAMLKQVLQANPDFLAAWTLWEPDAFDGKDQENVGKPGHDASGRYVPYWFRGTAGIEVEPLVDYEKEGPGDYYLAPKKSGEEMVIEPYLYKVAGKDTLITSLVAPIKRDGKFLGVVGIDISLASLI